MLGQKLDRFDQSIILQQLLSVQPMDSGSFISGSHDESQALLADCKSARRRIGDRNVFFPLNGSSAVLFLSVKLVRIVADVL